MTKKWTYGEILELKNVLMTNDVVMNGCDDCDYELMVCNYVLKPEAERPLAIL